MLTFVELCVDLKKGKLAKDGLYQYKNTAQNTNVGTIEVSLVDWLLPPQSPKLTLPARPQKIHSACRSQGHRCTGEGQPGPIHSRAEPSQHEC